MITNLPTFCETFLSSFDYKITNSADAPLLYHQIKFISKDFPQYSEETLFITFASKLPADGLPDCTQTWNLFCITDDAVPAVYYTYDSLNLVELERTTDPFQVYNAVALPLENFLSAQESFVKFLSSGSRSNTMQELVNSVAEVLRCPVAFLSEKLKVIASSANYTDSHPVWLSIQNRLLYHDPYLPSNFGTENQFVRPLPNSPESSGKWEGFFPVRSDNDTKTILGFLYYIYEPDHTMQRTPALLASISHVISWYFWRYANMPHHQDSDLTFMIFELLNGVDVNDTQISKRLEIINRQLQDSLYLVAVETSAASSKSLKWDSIKNTFQNLMPSCSIVTYNANLILFVPCSDLESIKWLQLSENLISLDCYAGISGPFQKYNQYLINHYTRAIRAAHMARLLCSKDHYIHYNRVALNDFIFNRPEDADLFKLIDPKLLELANHDKKYNTDYIHTLWAYWNSDRNILQTAKELCLHKNTLYYRLSKISDFLGYNLENTGVYLELTISLIIMEFIGIIPKFHTTFSTADLASYLKNDDI